MEIGCNNIYCVSPVKTGNASSKSQHANHTGVSSQGTSGLGGRSYYKTERKWIIIHKDNQKYVFTSSKWKKIKL